MFRARVKKKKISISLSQLNMQAMPSIYALYKTTFR